MYIKLINASKYCYKKKKLSYIIIKIKFKSLLYFIKL